MQMSNNIKNYHESLKSMTFSNKLQVQGLFVLIAVVQKEDGPSGHAVIGKKSTPIHIGLHHNTLALMISYKSMSQRLLYQTSIYLNLSALVLQIKFVRISKTW